MRLLWIAAGAFVFALEAAPAQALEWSQYFAFDDLFSVDFPSEPTIRETTYMTEFGFTLPARVYTAEDDFGTYSAMAVDWREAEELHQEGYEACQVRTGDRGGGDEPGLCSRLFQLLNEDGSRMFVSIFWHEYHLYITEAITPQGMPAPILFATSLGFLDEKGLRISYNDKYSPLFPIPRRTR